MNQRAHHTVRHALAMTCAALLFATGCAEDLAPVDDAASYESADQALRRVAGAGGAEGTDDGEPAFGDRGFADAFGDASRRTEADDLRDDVPDGGAVYHVLAVWGRTRENPATRPVPLRWNPEFRVNQGDVVSVRSTSDFERDDAVLPQRARNLVSLLSSTGGDVDGAVLQLRVSDPATASLSIHTEAVSLRYHGRGLASLNQHHLVDRSGNGIFLMVLDETPDVHNGAQGYMAGRWTITPEGGVAGGRVLDADGRVIGHMIIEFADGHYRGRVIDRRGNFRATVIGTYGAGAYRGEIYDVGGNQIGVMSGGYGADDSGGSGRFRGTWRRVRQSDTPAGGDDGGTASGRR